MHTHYLENGPPAKWASIANIFTALGDHYRQSILLAIEPNEAVSIQQLCKHLKIARTTVVHHLQILHSAGLLDKEIKGRETLYTLNLESLTTALNAVQEYAQMLRTPTEGA